MQESTREAEPSACGSYDELINRLIDHFLGIERGGRRAEADDVDFEQVR